jgi:hypothetical protein
MGRGHRCASSAALRDTQCHIQNYLGYAHRNAGQLVRLSSL